jgi:hypothetical protein
MANFSPILLRIFGGMLHAQWLESRWRIWRSGDRSMTQNQRNAAIKRLLNTYTAANTSSAAVARQGLIREGIYTEEGKLRREFDGKAKA